ncbi:nuclear cap-binding protein, putative [Eimeria brunetti]|uniref:Nuclear cap-binding protein subunit 2 n=1 Tax=Eimeria brunetti TaxID=51314 RepID=U6LCS5_9EIME|nr:nuclear cap-binding protein, putative [Eimeria brunetti]
MAELYEALEKVPTYYDRRTCTSLEDWKEAVRTSRAVYVGNLNYFTTEEELYELASHAGSVDRIIMGLNRLTRAPCGFAFVTFRSPKEAAAAVHILSGALCDGRVIRVDPDSGRDLDGDRKYGRAVHTPDRLFSSLSPPLPSFPFSLSSSFLQAQQGANGEMNGGTSMTQAEGVKEVN